MAFRLRYSACELITLTGWHVAALYGVSLLRLSGWFSLPLMAVVVAGFARALVRWLRLDGNALTGFSLSGHACLLHTRSGDVPVLLHRVVYRSLMLTVLDFAPDPDSVVTGSWRRGALRRRIHVLPDSLSSNERKDLATMLSFALIDVAREADPSD